MDGWSVVDGCMPASRCCCFDDVDYLLALVALALSTILVNEIQSGEILARKLQLGLSNLLILIKIKKEDKETGDESGWMILITTVLVCNVT